MYLFYFQINTLQLTKTLYNYLDYKTHKYINNTLYIVAYFISP